MIKQKTKNRLPRGAGREKEGRNSMKVVVFRSTGFLSGILRMIFGIKKEQE
ncbi:MAG: stage V sporulation protein SpoVM [Oscillospiraceae bacterium]|nr:stage V sporulation protein SpoVM [Oscillospiraceae bacterium]